MKICISTKLKKEDAVEKSISLSLATDKTVVAAGTHLGGHLRAKIISFLYPQKQILFKSLTLAHYAILKK